MAGMLPILLHSSQTGTAPDCLHQPGVLQCVLNLLVRPLPASSRWVPEMSPSMTGIQPQQLSCTHRALQGSSLEA